MRISDWSSDVCSSDLELDALIRKTIPGLQYAVKWKKAYYGLPKLGWVIEMVAYDVSVNVVFLGGADFKPPPPLGDTDRRSEERRVGTERVSTGRSRW